MVMIDTMVIPGATSIVTSAFTAPISIFRIVPGRVLRALSFMVRSDWRAMSLRILRLRSAAGHQAVPQQSVGGLRVITSHRSCQQRRRYDKEREHRKLVHIGHRSLRD